MELKTILNVAYRLHGFECGGIRLVWAEEKCERDCPEAPRCDRLQPCRYWARPLLSHTPYGA